MPNFKAFAFVLLELRMPKISIRRRCPMSIRHNAVIAHCSMVLTNGPTRLSNCIAMHYIEKNAAVELLKSINLR